MAVVKRDRDPSDMAVCISEKREDRYLQTIHNALTQNNYSVAPQFSNVNVENSNNVHFGNKIIIPGPVTIVQKDKNRENKEPLPNLIKEPVKGLKWIWHKAISKPFRYHLLTVMSVITIVIFLGVTLLFTIPGGNLVVYNKSTEDLNKNIPINTNIEEVLVISKKLRQVTRQEWLAQPTTEPGERLHHPVPMVIVQHTATENCTDQASCTFIIRFLQTYHIESRGLADIAYNFLIGGEGSVYEGRGWNIVGAHAKGYNECSFGIAFIGSYNINKPNERMINALSSLIKLGTLQGYINTDYKLLDAKQLNPSFSSGKGLFSIIETMDHFARDLNGTEECSNV